MLSLPRLFDEDARDGSLELLLTSPEPLAVLILARVAALSLALARCACRGVAGVRAVLRLAR